ncbi:MAG: hypothetical protein JSW72_02840 [Candidatus Bathyarchaeota archaeon]|nr:MAG: hypothetical protein JSW72_02840 [Candidatus Bathyarchaeota archaeon]
MKEENELKRKTSILRELGEDWRKNLAIINDATRGDREILESVKRLCKESNQGNMMKIGLTLIAFPLPIVIDDVLGWSFLAAGLIQKKIKNSGLYLEEMNTAFPNLMKELQDIRHDLL